MCLGFQSPFNFCFAIDRESSRRRRVFTQPFSIDCNFGRARRDDGARKEIVLLANSGIWLILRGCAPAPEGKHYRQAQPVAEGWHAFRVFHIRYGRKNVPLNSLHFTKLIQRFVPDRQLNQKSGAFSGCTLYVDCPGMRFHNPGNKTQT